MSTTLPETTLWGAAELAAFLRISADTVYRRRSRYPDTLPPAIKVGKRVYWVMSDVMNWFAAQKE